MYNKQLAERKLTKPTQIDTTSSMLKLIKITNMDYDIHISVFRFLWKYMTDVFALLKVQKDKSIYTKIKAKTKQLNFVLVKPHPYFILDNYMYQLENDIASLEALKSIQVSGIWDEIKQNVQDNLLKRARQSNDTNTRFQWITRMYEIITNTIINHKSHHIAQFNIYLQGLLASLYTISQFDKAIQLPSKQYNVQQFFKTFTQTKPRMSVALEFIRELNNWTIANIGVVPSIDLNDGQYRTIYASRSIQLGSNNQKLAAKCSNIMKRAKKFIQYFESNDQSTTDYQLYVRKNQKELKLLLMTDLDKNTFMRNGELEPWHFPAPFVKLKESLGLGLQQNVPENYKTYMITELDIKAFANDMTYMYYYYMACYTFLKYMNQDITKISNARNSVYESRQYNEKPVTLKLTEFQIIVIVLSIIYFQMHTKSPKQKKNLCQILATLSSKLDIYINYRKLNRDVLKRTLNAIRQMNMYCLTHRN